MASIGSRNLAICWLGSYTRSYIAIRLGEKDSIYSDDNDLLHLVLVVASILRLSPVLLLQNPLCQYRTGRQTRRLVFQDFSV